MENNKIPTAEEFSNSYTFIEMGGTTDFDKVYEFAVEFAKMHVQAALKEASEKARQETDEWGHFECIDKHSILNAYPLDNIK